MPVKFTFEASNQYKTFAARRNKQLYYAAVVYLCIIIFSLIVMLVISNKQEMVIDAVGVICLWLVLGLYSAIVSAVRVRNYIIKLVYNDGVIAIDHAHYDDVTHYTGKLSNFEIRKKKSFFGGSKRKAAYYLIIKVLYDDIVIKQGEDLDWDVKLMDEFIAAIKEPIK